jgi:cysteinyl-tRNA synthetase
VRNVRARLAGRDEAGPTELDVERLEEFRAAFTDAMDDDLNTPRAIAVLHDLAREVNRWLEGDRDLGHAELLGIDSTFRELGGTVLGLIPDQLGAGGGVEEELLEGLLQIILDIRQGYRETRDWARADALRDRLSKLGIAVEDRPDGATWRLESR